MSQQTNTPTPALFPALRMVQDKIHKTAQDKGFWKQTENQQEEHVTGNMLSAIMLAVTELAEAAEAYRKQDKENLEIELADTIIRILDFAAGYKLNVIEAMFVKMAYNKTRPHLHGKTC